MKRPVETTNIFLRWFAEASAKNAGTSTAALDSEVDQLLVEMEADTNPDAPLTALAMSQATGRDVPAWAIDRVAQAATRYLHNEVRSLDEALGLSRHEGKGTRWRMAEHQFDAQHGVVCYAYMTLAMSQGAYSETEASQLVAEEIGQPATPAKVLRNYRRIKSLNAV